MGGIGLSAISVTVFTGVKEKSEQSDKGTNKNSSHFHNFVNSFLNCKVEEMGAENT